MTPRVHACVCAAEKPLKPKAGWRCGLKDSCAARAACCRYWRQQRAQDPSSDAGNGATMSSESDNEYGF